MSYEIPGRMPGACVLHASVTVFPRCRSNPQGRSRYRTSAFPTTSQLPSKLPTYAALQVMSLTPHPRRYRTRGGRGLRCQEHWSRFRIGGPRQTRQDTLYRGWGRHIQEALQQHRSSPQHWAGRTRVGWRRRVTWRRMCSGVTRFSPGPYTRNPEPCP